MEKNPSQVDSDDDMFSQRLAQSRGVVEKDVDESEQNEIINSIL